MIKNHLSFQHYVWLTDKRYIILEINILEMNFNFRFKILTYLLTVQSTSVLPSMRILIFDKDFIAILLSNSVNEQGIYLISLLAIFMHTESQYESIWS